MVQIILMVPDGAMQFIDSTWNQYKCSGSKFNRQDALNCAAKKISKDSGGGTIAKPESGRLLKNIADHAPMLVPVAETIVMAS